MIHGADHGVIDPANAVVPCLRRFGFDGVVIAHAHAAELVFIQQDAEIDIAIDVECLSFGFQQDGIVRGSEAKFVYGVFDLGRREPMKSWQQEGLHQFGEARDGRVARGVVPNHMKTLLVIIGAVP